MATANENDSSMALRTAIGTSKYSLVDNAPPVIEISCSGVYVHKDGPFTQSVTESFPERRWNRDKVLSQKFKGFGSGEYGFFLNFMPTSLFESREKFDTLLSEEWKEAEPSDNLLPSVTTIDRISLVEALKCFDVELSCNMEHYLANKEQLERDLGQVLDGEFEMQEVVRDLFSKVTLEMFGPDENENDGLVCFRDFRKLFYDGEDMYGSAQRGNLYFVFIYQTS